jgi:hypothetical protein
MIVIPADAGIQVTSQLGRLLALRLLGRVGVTGH